MWGKLQNLTGFTRVLRTIPTHVGKTTLRASGSMEAADHPHACGENRRSLHHLLHVLGPSPRMWGKPRRRRNRLHLRRTIPTHVGKTHARSHVDGPLPDHPHACGENALAMKLHSPAYGPSPRMWGKQMLEHDDTQASRTIPTHVGKTFPL